MKNQSKQSEMPRHKKKSRLTVVLLGFSALIVGVVVVTALTADTNKNQKLSRVAIVRITESGFEPATLSVKQGTKVIWTNIDTSLHTVASNPQAHGDDIVNLKSEILNNGQSYEYVANTPGDFSYHDGQQPTVNGTIIVKK
jgi:plastocyanin